MQFDQAGFIAALRLTDPEARLAYLEQACGADLQFRRKIEELLVANDRAQANPLDEAAEEFQAKWAAIEGIADEDPMDLSSQPLVGPYKLQDRLGEGGMGTVFMARQTAPIRRDVALKIIKPGMDSKQVLARFEAERQALALMDHPNIARVLDAGATDNGRPYFVMELVKGAPITEYCDSVKMPIDDRLRLFSDACQGVQHAHQKGVIHRDLKPGNLLVTLHDGKAVVKIIDFGIAKSINQELTERTLFTHYAQLMGTPLYMSPEQAELRGLDVDTRTDVYSLGVLLYELLTGTTPFDSESLRELGLDAVRRMICETEPPRPSRRISAMTAERTSDSRQLHLALRGELDWIVMRALEKDRDRRYETASAFAADIERYLEDIPVEACPPSVAYRFNKLARRHKTALSMAVIVVISLFVGTSISIWQARRAIKSERLAEERLTRSEHNFERARKAESKAKRSQQLAASQRLAFRRQSYAASMIRGSHLLESGYGNELRRVLQGWDESIDGPDLRGWEWYHLMAQADQAQREWDLGRFDSNIHSIAWSPDGQLIAIGASRGQVRVLHTEDGTLQDEFVFVGAKLHSIAWHPQGRQIAIAGEGGPLTFRNVDEHRTQVLDLGVSNYRFVAWSQAGQLAATADLTDGETDGLVYLWSAGRQGTPTKLSHDKVYGAAWSPSGNRLVSVSDDGSIKVWDRQGKLLAQRQATEEHLWSVEWSPHGSKFVVAGQQRLGDYRLMIFDAVASNPEGQTMSPTAELFGHTNIIRDVAWSPDGSRIASASADGLVIVWDVRSRTILRRLGAHQKQVICAAWSPNGQLASGGEGRQLLIWKDPLLVKKSIAVNAISVDWLGDDLLLGGSALTQPMITLLLWPAQKSEWRFALTESKNNIQPLERVSVSPNGKYFAAANRARDFELDKEEDVPKCRVWKNGSGVPGPPQQSIDGRIFAWVDCGNAILTDLAESKDSIQILEIASGQKKSIEFGRSNKRKGNPTALAAWPTDGTSSLIIMGDDLGTIIVWTLIDRNWQQRHFWYAGEYNEHHEMLAHRIRAMAISPDGKQIATAVAESTTVNLWNVTTKTCTQKLIGHRDDIATIAWYPTGDRIATGSNDGTIKIWDPVTADEVLSIDQPVGIRSLAWNEAGNRLASTSKTGSVHVYEAQDRSHDSLRRLDSQDNKYRDQTGGN